MYGNIKVLIVDDSSIVRQALTKELNKIPGIEVVAAAQDPYIARDLIVSKEPDVITLDIEMPRMDGLTFLRRIMHFHPIPTVVVSSLTEKGAEMTLACLEAGAVEVLCKPGVAYSVADMGEQLGRAVKAAARADVSKILANQNKPAPVANSGAMLATTNKIVAIGSSTGGTEALARVLTNLPKQAPGIVMTQHMPPGFTTSFSERLNSMCNVEVREARDGDSVSPGVALLAPGEKHMELVRSGARYMVRVRDGERVCRHRPSVEVLFNSVAKTAGKNSLGIMLTGMGDDGAQGMRAMHEAGAVTIAQSEATCVVYGMPRAAVEAGGVDHIVDLDDITNQIVLYAQGKLGQTPRSKAA
ncbi:MAG: protein-glutamate methylesterase/protein-glutamine glutaminase [Planctomycetota bacterium]|jgi:two-component system chemotaxis response regulator CheB